MNVIYMGTPEFAVPTLEALVASQHKVRAVVCQPDRPARRGMKLQAPPVKSAAQRLQIPVLQPERIKSKDGKRQLAFVEELRAFAADVIVVAAYGRILPREVLELPRLGCLNVHASLLPKYRGAAPINWAIVRGETETGISIMQMDEGLDTGDVLATDKLEILPDDDAESLKYALSVIGATLLVRTLDEIAAGNPPKPVPQSTLGEPTLAPPLSKEDGRLDWSQTTEQIILRINGFCPWPGAWTPLGQSGTLQILKAEPFPYEIAEAPPKADPGQVIALEKGRGFVVQTGDGQLLVTRVKPANKGAMDAWSACNGGVVKVGSMLAPATS